MNNIVKSSNRIVFGKSKHKSRGRLHQDGGEVGGLHGKYAKGRERPRAGQATLVWLNRVRMRSMDVGERDIVSVGLMVIAPRDGLANGPG